MVCSYGLIALIWYVIIPRTDQNRPGYVHVPNRLNDFITGDGREWLMIEYKFLV